MVAVERSFVGVSDFVSLEGNDNHSLERTSHPAVDRLATIEEAEVVDIEYEGLSIGDFEAVLGVPCTHRCYPSFHSALVASVVGGDLQSSLALSKAF